MLVLAIGLLGIALVQTRSLSSNNSSMSRSMAIMASYSILEAMRADRANATGGGYNTSVAANSCPATGTSVAAQQLNNWCVELGQALGAVASTTGAVRCDGVGTCTITLTYDDSRIGVGGTATQTVVTKSIL